MKSYDLYMIESAEDALKSANAGIFDFRIGATECENCGLSVGPLDDVFVPCAVLYGSTMSLEEEVWPVCIDCIAPLIFPGLWVDGQM